MQAFVEVAMKRSEKTTAMQKDLIKGGLYEAVSEDWQDQFQ